MQGSTVYLLLSGELENTNKRIDNLPKAFVPQGTIPFSSLPQTATKDKLGYIWNISDAFTTDSRFIEGAGKKIDAGNNVGVIMHNNSYYYDVMSQIDLSNYYTKEEVTDLINTEKTEREASDTALDTSKLNILPKVDDPTDPGFGWEYHIPYRFDVSLDTDKANIDLHTLTLDNKVTKMKFSKQIPSASTTTAGLMSSSDKESVNKINSKADLPPECPAWLNPTGQTPYPWFMASLDVESTGKGPDADGNLLVDVGAYNFNNKQYYKWEKSLPFAATTTKAGLMTAADKTKLNSAITEHQDISGKQDKLTAGKNITITDNVIKSNAEFITLTGTSGTLTDEQLAVISDNSDAYISLGGKPFRFSNVVAGRAIIATYANSTGTDNDIILVNIGSKAWEYAKNQLQPKLTAGDNISISENTISAADTTYTAGENITIDENNVISATGGSFDGKTILKGTDNNYQTAVGGWKEDTPEQTTELFINTKGNGLPTYLGPSASPVIYEVGWDYNKRISDLITGRNASINIDVTILDTNFNGKVALTKSVSIPANWESDTITIGGKSYKIKIGEGWVGINQGGLTIMANDPSTDISDSTMKSLALVTGSASVVYHPIDNKFLKTDSTLSVDADNNLKVNTDIMQSKLTAGVNVQIAGGTISATDTTYTAGTGIDITNNIISNTVSPLVPSQASSANKLADKAFVTDAVSSASANFRGTWSNYNVIPTDASQYPQDYTGSTIPTTNDYLVVQNASDYTAETISGTWRFKYSGLWSSIGKSGWLPEYQISTEPLTSEQLAALNSGVTSSTVSQVTTNTTAIAGKQDKLTAGNHININANEISVTVNTIFDIIYPVGSYHFGVTAPAIGTWEKVTGDRAIWIKSDSSDGTNIGQALPIPSIASTFTGTEGSTSTIGNHSHSASSGGDHNHDRGDMNIYGLFNMFWENINTSGALFGERCDYDNPMMDSSKKGTYRLGINAASNWTGHTNTTGAHAHTIGAQGAHTHTFTPAGSVATSVTADTIYKSGANVQPNAIVMTVWKRVA